MYPLTTAPPEMSWVTTDSMVSSGMAKEMPEDCPSGGAGGGGAGGDGDVHADDAPEDVHERPAGVAGVHRRVGLDEVGVPALEDDGGGGAPQARDDPLKPKGEPKA